MWKNVIHFVYLFKFLEKFSWNNFEISKCKLKKNSKKVQKS